MNKIQLCTLTLFLFFAGCSKGSDKVVLPPDPPDDDSSTSPAYSVPEVDNEMTAFMNRYNVPGISVAITKNGKLVYIKSYGYADKENSTLLTDSSLFRIASLSKSITSVAIMKLVDEGKLTLDSKVFGEGALLGTEYGTPPYLPGVTDITISHLLHHTGGGWGNSSNDPMFTNPSFTAQELISWTIDNRPLDNAPGASYAYSNFGYCILGRVIEKLTGQNYEAYIKSAVLQPAGVTDMEVGGNTLAEQKPNEVKYYDGYNESPYIYNISRMDSHGGWLASATDLLRILVHADGFSNVPDIISAQRIAEIAAPSSANPNYACGWMVNSSGNWWHSGLLPGTSTWLTRTASGYTWAILTNTRSTDSNYSVDMDRLIWPAVNNQATPWTSKDLF